MKISYKIKDCNRNFNEKISSYILIKQRILF